MIENRAGQPFTAIWFPAIVTKDGQERNYDVEGKSFWCTKTSPQRCSRQFRNNIEGKTITMVLGSTNVSKLKGIEDDSDATVVFHSKKYKVTYAEYDDLKGTYSVALT